MPQPPWLSGSPHLGWGFYLHRWIHQAHQDATGGRGDRDVELKMMTYEKWEVLPFNLNDVFGGLVWFGYFLQFVCFCVCKKKERRCISPSDNKMSLWNDFCLNSILPSLFLDFLGHVASFIPMGFLQIPHIFGEQDFVTYVMAAPGYGSHWAKIWSHWCSYSLGINFKLCVLICTDMLLQLLLVVVII